MKQLNKSNLLALVIIFTILMSGCQKKVDGDENTALKTNNNNQKDMTQSPQNESDVTNIPTWMGLENIKELEIYSLDSETSEIISNVVVVSSDISVTPEFIVNKVVDSMADETFMIGIDSVTTQENSVIVSFLDDQPPVRNVGSYIEVQILDALAMSLIDNLPDYDQVIYRIMGEAYVSGHLEYDKNHVYMKR